MNSSTAAAGAPSDRYVLKLYITGSTQRSTRAIANITRVCDTLLAGKADLQIIDLYQDPNAGIEDQIIALPTLVKVSPGAVRRIIGDLSDHTKLLNTLGLNVSGSTIE